MPRVLVFVCLWTSLALLAASAAAHPGEEPDAADSESGLTLEPTRQLAFTTDEGTWISLDVSPDGATICFELLGDLYTVPIEGGAAARITNGMAFDSQPRYSPDGEHIAFVSDRDGAQNLWIANADGSEPHQVTKDATAAYASPEWMPDGEWLVVSRSPQGFGTYELWMFHRKGGSGLRVTKSHESPSTPRAQRHNAIGAVPSPDGRFLYYAMRRGGFEYNATFPMWQIARRDLERGDEDVLTQAGGSGIRPALSPDGRRLVYGTRHDTETGLRVRDLTTGADRWLAWPIQRDDQESRFTRDLLPGYDFTPDGAAIVLSHGGRLHRIDIETGADTEIPFTADVELDLGPLLEFPRRVDQGPVRARLAQGATASPDGSRLAFSTLTRLYVMDLPNGEPRRVTADALRGFQPAWSPDGRWLAFVSWTTDGGALWKVRADGSAPPQRLTEVPAFYASPVWSPDGARIVSLRSSTYTRLTRSFDSWDQPDLDVVWTPADGGSTTLIAPARGRGSPHFADDPDRVFVTSSEGLVSMRLDGTDRRTHVLVKGKGLYFAEEPVPASDLRISPDGRWLLAHVKNQLYLVAVPPVGGETPIVDVDSPSLPVARLTDIGADAFEWGRDGDEIVWSLGAAVFRRPLSDVAFEKEDEDEDEGEEGGTDTAGDGAADRAPADDAADDAPDDAAADAEATDAEAADADADATPRPAAEEHASVERFDVVLEFPRAIPEGTLVLRGARVITMRGDEILPRADVVVERNRIAAIGAVGEVEIPGGAHVMHCDGKTIVPGFIDTHAHWFEIRRGVLDVQNWSFLANLAYGVTAGLDVQTMTNDMFAYQDLVDIGEILGPRAFSTGPGLFSDNDFQSFDQARHALRKYVEHYGTHNLKAYISGNRRQRQFIVRAAHELGMMPTTEGALDLALNLTHMLDGFIGNEHSLPIVPLYRDVIELAARSGTGNTPTLLVSYGGPWAENFFYTTTEVHDDVKLNRFVPHEIVDEKTRRRPWFRDDEYVHPKLAAEVAKIVDAGGRVGIGSHGQLQGLGFHWEMWALASGGMPPHDVLRAATRHGAELIGVAQDLGSLEPGKLADLVVLDGDPLADIRATNTVHWVMKNGELFEADTLDRVWPSVRSLEPLRWWDDRPPGR